MPVLQNTIEQLASIPHLEVSQGTLLSAHTRFGIGGPADVYAEAPDESSFMEALRIVRSSGTEYAVIGDGTNLIVSDSGFRGIVLRLTARSIEQAGTSVDAQAGAELQTLVDYCI